MEFRLHPKQAEVLLSPATEILFGGAAGPGKSHLLRVAAIIWCNDIPNLQVYLIRRTYPELWANHMEGPNSFRALLHPWVETGKVRIVGNDIRFRNGACIHLRHCQHEQDKYNFQGTEIHCLLVDELTTFTEATYYFLRSRVRMSGITLPDRWKGRFPRIVCGSNPGNIGHAWVLADFVSFGTAIHKTTAEEGGMTRQYIPAKMDDNPSLMSEDPSYKDRLHGLGDDALIRAMELGDWDIIAGGALSDLWQSGIHVMPSFKIPRGWYVDRSFDWGSSKPFSVGWWAESNGSEATLDNGMTKAWPKGTLFRISEWYGWSGKPNKGCFLEDSAIGKGIREREEALKDTLEIRSINPGPADSSIFDADPGKASIAQGIDMGYGRSGCFYPADKRPGSRIRRLSVLRRLLAADLETPMEDPGIFFFSGCLYGAIRTLPILPRDPRNAEDVDTYAEDHAYDDVGYRITTARRASKATRLEAA
jgi:hypothetical protein